MTKIGLLGGSFDPIHNGHLMIAAEIRRSCGLDRVILLPSADPPHKAGLLALRHRLRMVELAIEGDPGLELSSFDSDRTGPTYTIDTILHFQELLGEAELHWIVGADSLNELATWRRAPELVDRCRIVTAGRPGSNAVDWRRLGETFSAEQVRRLRDGVQDTPQLDVSSTRVRSQTRHGGSIGDLVPDPVREYIESHGLYS